MIETFDIRFSENIWLLSPLGVYRISFLMERRPGGADRQWWTSGGNDGACHPVRDDPGEHGASDHGGVGKQHSDWNKPGRDSQCGPEKPGKGKNGIGSTALGWKGGGADLGDIKCMRASTGYRNPAGREVDFYVLQVLGGLLPSRRKSYRIRHPLP